MTNQNQTENEQRVIRTDDSKQLPGQFFKKSHELVFSQLTMTPKEHDIMALLLTRLHKDHWDSFIDGTAIRAPVYQFNSDVLSEWFGVKKVDLYNTLVAPSEGLSRKQVGLKNPEKNEFDYINLFKRLSYKDATLTIIPNDELLNEYLGISQGHAQVDHRIFRKLKKEHSKRLYPLLCRFKSKNTQLHTFTVEELHQFFGLLDPKGNMIKKSYASNKVFLDRCVRNSIEEIEKLDSNIRFLTCEQTGSFGYQPIKHGRKIAKIKFLFTWHKVKAKEEIELREELSKEQESLKKSEMIYQLIIDFIPNDDGNPTVDELNELMANAPMLTSQGYKMDGDFMVKLGQAMTEALSRKP